MLSIIKPYGVGKVADQYKDLFPNSYMTYANLCALFCLYLFGLESISALLRSCGWCSSTSELSRAVNDFNVYDKDNDGTDKNMPIKNRFLRRAVASILKKFPDMNEEDFIFALDDTGNPRYGKNHHGVGVWANSSGGKFYGQKILVLAIVNLNTKQAYPIGYIFLRKLDENNPENHETGHEAGIRLLKEALNNGFPTLPLAADSWFGSIDMMEEVKKLNINFTSELKSNRNMKDNISPNVKFKKAAEIFKDEEKIKTDSKRQYPRRTNKNDDIKYYAEKILFLKDSNRPYKVVAVYNKKNDKEPFSVYINMDIKKSGEWIWSLSRARWCIETMFRNLKQNLSFGRLPSECKEGSDLSVCLPFALYISLCLKKQEFFDIKMFGSGTIGTLINRIRELNINKTLNIMMINPSHSCLKLLMSRRDIMKINKNPVNTPSEQLSA